MADNRFIDTRGNLEQPVAFTQAVVDGLASGGGLYVPEHLPHFTEDELRNLARLPYWQRAAAVYKALRVDLPDETVDSLMRQIYGNAFDTEDVCPITTLSEGTHVLELWHGPTSAFKDMALQCLPRFFQASAQKLRAQGKLEGDFLILVATSGDTGKAALEGFRDVEGVRIAVMYPHGGVSDIQYKQMATQRGSNVDVWAVRGNFDDCQTGAKQVFSDADFNERLAEEQGVALSSANSINFGRLAPQIVYYLSACGTLLAEGEIEPGGAVDVCVPTGNFGNILAAYYAKVMGAPIGMLLCASNENRVLADFINTGTYDIADRPFVLTPSPSMDILVSSNLERQLFELTDRDAGAIRGWMRDLGETKRFRVDEETFARMRQLYAADSVSNDDCLATIKEVFDEHDYLMDPHTAVAYRVAERLRGENPVLIASTAHWAKFGDNVYRALHGMAAGEALPEAVAALSGCQLNRLIAEETGDFNIPAGLAELDSLPIRFSKVINPGAASIEESVTTFLQEGASA